MNSFAFLPGFNTGYCRPVPGSNPLITQIIRLSLSKFLEMVYLTRLEHFNAAHKLYNPGWTKEQNEAVFGLCANENWHGHNFELYVTDKGNPDPDTGFLMDVKVLSKIVNEQVIEALDHKNLNIEVPFLQGKMCTTETLAMAIWGRIFPHLPAAVQLHAIKLYETPRIYVEYFGENQ